MIRRPWMLVALPVVALTLTLSGCGGGGETDGTAATEQSPLTKYMNALYGMGGDEADWQKTAIENSKKTEDLVAACMSKEGFEYVPAPQTEESFQSSGDMDWKPDDRDWVAQYGYGAVNSPMNEQPETTAAPDPNGEYVSSLSESEQTAYYATLYGEQPTEEEASSGEWSPTWEEQGCYGAANHEIQGEDPTTAEENKPIMDAIQKLYEDASNSPAVAELNAAWADCMTGEGHGGFATQTDAQTSIYDKINAYYETQTEYVEDDPKLKAIGEEEIELALADLTCREKTDYTAKSQKAQFALEDQFISDHKAELDALLASAEKARS